MIFEYFKIHRKMQLLFALVCGAAYFSVILSFIYSYTAVGGGFLAFLFCPAIVCGAALCIIKTLRRYIEDENKKAVNFMFFAHIIIIISGIFTAVERFV